MKTILIILSEQCNMNCSFCFIHPKRNIVLNIDGFLAWFEKYKTICNNEKIEISFFGGEPILQALDVIKIIENTKYSNTSYSITTNLMYYLTPEIIGILDLCSVCTSWDPIQLRFKTQDNFELWRHNCKQIKLTHVNITLTKELLSIKPNKLIKDCISWGFTGIFFTCLNPEGKALQLEYPNWEEVDDWLCKLYTVCPQELKINLFENFKLTTCDTDWHKIGSFSDLTVHPDGSILMNSNVLSIYDPIDYIYNLYKKNIIKSNTNISCRVCEYYRYCNINVKWLGNICPFPKNLFRLVTS